jgi:hypothetical protein
LGALGQIPAASGERPQALLKIHQGGSEQKAAGQAGAVGTGVTQEIGQPGPVESGEPRLQDDQLVDLALEQGARVDWRSVGIGRAGPGGGGEGKGWRGTRTTIKGSLG